MKRLLMIPFLIASIFALAACSSETEEDSGNGTGQPEVPVQPGGDEDPGDSGSPDGSGRTKTLVAYFSAQGHTQAVAERIVELRVRTFTVSRLPTPMQKILTMIVTASRTKPTMTCVREWPIFPRRGLWPLTTRFLSVHPVGGINRPWWSALSSKPTTCRAR